MTDWQPIEEHEPRPHAVYRVWHRADQRMFDATPCYGMHSPWWVPRNGFTLAESDPIPMTDTDWQPLPEPPEQTDAD